MTITQVAILFGVPTGITGLFLWWLKRSIDQSAKRAEDRDRARQQTLIYLIKLAIASADLGEEIGRAIKTGTTNGAMDSALRNAGEATQDIRNYMGNLATKSIYIP